MKLGVGYLIGAKDDGILKLIKTVRDGILGVAEETERVADAEQKISKNRPIKELAEDGKEANSWLKTMLSSANTLLGSLTQFQLIDIRDKLGELTSGIDGATSGGMTTKMEGMFTEFDKSFKATAVRTGIYGKDLKKLESQVFSTSFALNRGADEVGNNVLALHRSGLTFAQILGDKSTMADFQKVVEATGMTAQDYASTFQELNKSWGMGEKGARDFFDQYSKQATALGIGQEAFEALPGMLQDLDKEWAVTLQAMGPDAVKSALLGTAKLGAMLQEVTGDDPKKSMAEAGSMFSALAKSGHDFTKLMVGLDGGLTPLTEELAFLDVGAGGVQGALEELGKGAKDPAKFMATLGKVVGELDKKGGTAAKTMKTRLLASLEEIDPSMAFLAQNGDKVGVALAAIDAKSKGAGLGMKELGDQAFTTGLTLDDVLDRAKMGLEQAFGSAFHAERVKIVGLVVSSYQTLGGIIRALAGDTKKSDKAWRGYLAVIGISGDKADWIKGVFESWRAEMNSWFDKAGPLATFLAGLTTLGGMFGTVLLAMSPFIAMIVGAAATIGGVLMSAITAVVGAISAGTIGASLSVVGTIAAALAGILLNVAFYVGVVAAAFGALYLVLTGQVDDAVVWVSDSLQKAFVYVADWGSKMLQSLTGWLKGFDGAELAKDVSAYVKSLVAGMMSGFDASLTANPEVKTSGSRLMSAMLEFGSTSWKIVSDFATEIGTEVWSALKAYPWKQKAGELLGYIADGLMSAKSALTSGGNWLYGAVIDWVDSVDWAGVSNQFFGYIADGLMSAKSALTSGGNWLYGAVIDWIDSVDWAGVSEQFYSTMSAYMESGMDYGSGLFDSLSGWIESVNWAKLGEDVEVGIDTFLNDALSGGLSYAFDKLLGQSQSTSLLGSVGSAIGGILGSALDAFFSEDLWSSIGKLVWSGLGVIGDLFFAFTSFVGGMFLGFGRILVDALFGEGTWAAGFAMFGTLRDKVLVLGEWFNDLWADIRQGAFDLFGNSINTFVEHDFGIIGNIIETAKGWFGSLKDVATTMFDGILAGITLFLKPLGLVGDAIQALATQFGFKAPDVQAVVAQAKSDPTAPVKTLIQQSGDTLLVTTIIDQHNQDRLRYDKMIELLGRGSTVAGSTASRTSPQGANGPIARTGTH